MEHFNLVTKNVFSTANQEHLTQHAQLHGLSSNEWAGFRQWETVGRRVAKGAKGCKIYMAVKKNVDSDTPVKDDQPGQDQPKKRNVVKGAYVFNFQHTVEIDTE